MKWDEETTNVICGLICCGLFFLAGFFLCFSIFNKENAKNKEQLRECWQLIRIKEEQK